MSVSGKVAVVGVDESERIGVVHGASTMQLHAEAARNALRDAGLSAGDVDGPSPRRADPRSASRDHAHQPRRDQREQLVLSYAPMLRFRQPSLFAANSVQILGRACLPKLAEGVKVRSAMTTDALPVRLLLATLAGWVIAINNM